MPAKRRLRVSRVISYRLGACLVLLLGAMVSSLSAQARHCGTGRLMEKPGREVRSLEKGSAVDASAPAKPVRTLETPHFLIHYVMRGPNRVKTLKQDEPLLAMVDSLYVSLPSAVTGDAADSMVYARLKAREASHPVYIDTMAGYFEKAYLYYVDTLGMRAPSESAPSSYYSAATKSGKYPIDVADIGTVYEDYRNEEYYAFTYRPGEGGILMENDFLFRSRMGPDGIPIGDTISSRYQGRVIHNYAEDWNIGLKVTCFHELYHSVQFAYTPNERSYHVWYEASATGMEERKAPESNDYLQYLPYYFQDLAEKGMFGFAPQSLSHYGAGIYHLFLTSELGEGFDAGVWKRLAENDNSIKEALAFTFNLHGKSAGEVFARFGAQLAFSGSEARNPVPGFSPDLPLWPRLSTDSMDLRNPSNFTSLQSHPPMSIRARTLLGSGNSGKALFQVDTTLRTVLARLRPDSSSVVFFRTRIVPLDMPGAGGEVSMILVNATSDRTASGIEIRLLNSRLDTAVYAYPNPLNMSAGESSLIFSRIPVSSRVRLYGESGSILKVLDFDPSADLWSWDLTDEKDRKVKPGIYYYRVDSKALRPVHIR